MNTVASLREHAVDDLEQAVEIDGLRDDGPRPLGRIVRAAHQNRLDAWPSAADLARELVTPRLGQPHVAEQQIDRPGGARTSTVDRSSA